MSEDSNIPDIKDLAEDLMGRYNVITLSLIGILVGGIVLSIFGLLLPSGDLQIMLSILGMTFILGVIVGGTAGFWFGLTLSWIIPIPIALVLSVYIGFLNHGAIGAFYASYSGPIIASLTGWLVSVKKSTIDEDVEYKYLLEGGSLFSRH